ncbi:Protoporphyrin ferrochelatase [Alteripontixanthobacter maritimus]|uniref:Ferrochelatase n=1 Tax=Alteripontixanthobacter maritimus TaxID=2161824 RepID=A0A369Q2C5_9SPHN|nr:ferrochelatase [Alteripontixanthobacter maritimus]RDC59053.1 Protoporphyrin ferrochelatase [Alteripontixanthobacter maritimus]
MTHQPQQLPADHPPVNSGNIAVLLVNLGTPDAPDTKSVKRYLAEFLSDRRVVEIPPIAWQPILRGIILNTRPKKSAHAYSQVWTEDGSPLAAITRAQAEKLQPMLGAPETGGVKVDWAMRYGNPSIQSRIEALMADGCERILLAPLYPQYSGATTATVVDKAAETLGKMRWQASLRTLPPYHDDPAYIGALASDLGAQLDALDFTPEVLLLSFHGMPQRTLELGDPYHCHCRKTARLLEDRLARPDLRILITFQSRFGPAKWLEPATDTTIGLEADAGTKRMAVATPGFSADCLETLEEIAIQGREQFLDAGGEHFATLACLNDRPEGMAMLETIVRRELSGWI